MIWSSLPSNSSLPLLAVIQPHQAPSESQKMPSGLLIIYTCSLFWFFTTQTILLLCCLHRPPDWLPHWRSCWSVAPLLITQHTVLHRSTICFLSSPTGPQTAFWLFSHATIYWLQHIQAFNKSLLKMNEVWRGAGSGILAEVQEGEFLGSKGIVNRCYRLRKDFQIS